MPVSATTELPRRRASAKVARRTVLVAVKPSAMGKVIEHLFRGQRGLQVFAHRKAAGDLPERARRLSPDLIVADTRLLGRARWQALSEIKRCSPDSKLVVICPLGGFAREARANGADACLEEEAVVSQLLSTLRRLAP